jgi:hypothetical protein
MSQLLWDLPPRVGSLLLLCHLRRSNNLVDQQKRTNNLHGAFFSMAVIAVQEVKSETQLPQVDNSHDLKELHVVSQDNERHQLGIEFNNQLPPAAAVSNKNHHPSFVDLASRSESSFAEMTNVDFSREVVPARAEVSPKNMAQEIVDAAYLAGSMDNLAALVVPLHPCKCIPSYPESYSGIK